MIGLRLLTSKRRSRRSHHRAFAARPIRLRVLLVVLLFTAALLIQLPDIGLDVLAKAIVAATATRKSAD